MVANRRRNNSRSAVTKKSGGIFYIFILIAMLGGIYLFSSFLKDFSTGKEKNRYLKMMKEKTEMLGFTDEFYKREFVVKTIDAVGWTLQIKANNFGERFWRGEFKKIVKECENRTYKLLDFEKQINKVENGKHRKVSLTDYPELISIFEKTEALSNKTLFNIASGEVFEFWNFTKNQKKIPPKMKNVKDFIKFATLSNIEFDPKNKTIEIKNINTAIKFDLFKESIFLELLRKRLPKDMNYLILLGDRNGIWKLDKKYNRWSIALRNPYKVLDFERGAMPLIAEQGVYSVTRKLEKSFEYKGKEYSSPIDWRDGLPSTKNISVFVLDDDIITARIKSYSLFISSKKEIKEFENNFKSTQFLILDSKDKVYVPKASKDDFISLEKINERQKK